MGKASWRCGSGDQVPVAGYVNDDLSSAHVCLQLEEVYGEIFRVLKPGAVFASYEWVSTTKYNSSNKEHVRIIDEINFGNGLPVSLSPCTSHRECLCLSICMSLRMHLSLQA